MALEKLDNHLNSCGFEFSKKGGQDISPLLSSIGFKLLSLGIGSISGVSHWGMYSVSTCTSFSFFTQFTFKEKCTSF